MKIDLEKILTISASDYCAMVGRDISTYIPKGVHCSNYDLPNIAINIHFDVPEGTEVIVNYQFADRTTRSGNLFIESGTALIPLIPKTK